MHLVGLDAYRGHMNLLCNSTTTNSINLLNLLNLQGIEYTEEQIKLCEASKSVSYKIFARRDNKGDVEELAQAEGLLKKETLYYEMKDGRQIFSIEDIEREIIAMQLIGTCKSYLINIAAEIKGKLYSFFTIY